MGITELVKEYLAARHPDRFDLSRAEVMHDFERYVRDSDEQDRKDAVKVTPLSPTKNKQAKILVEFYAGCVPPGNDLLDPNRFNEGVMTILQKAIADGTIQDDDMIVKSHVVTDCDCDVEE